MADLEKTMVERASKELGAAQQRVATLDIVIEDLQNDVSHVHRVISCLSG